MISALRHLPFSAVYERGGGRLGLVPISACQVETKDPEKEMGRFLDTYRPDVVVTWGTRPPDPFPRLWAESDIRWVHAARWDLFDPRHDWAGANLTVPNSFTKERLSKLGLRSTVIPVPVDTDRIPFRRRERAESFVSIVGRGGPFHRRGLPEILLAWSEMQSPAPITILSQEPAEELSRSIAPDGVKLDNENLSDPAELYACADMAVQPSRHDSTGTVILEAMAAGLPVITTDAAPVRDLAPEFLVRAEETTEVDFHGKKISVSIPSFIELRRLVEKIKGSDISSISEKVRARVEKEYSWKALCPEWLRLITGKCGLT